MINLSLKKFFEKLGLSYTLGLNGLIRRQKGIDAIGYIPVDRKVTSKKGKKFTRKSKRLVDTGKFNQDAFVYSATESTLTIEGNPNAYDSNVTYADITAYNDKNSPYLKGKHGATIKRVGSSIFPWTEKEFLDTLKNVVNIDLDEAIEDDLEKQIEDYLQTEIKNLKF